MILFLAAQDLHSLWIGIIQENEFVRLEERQNSPDGYLRELDDFLKETPISDLEGVCLVTGPGSFTSSRIILTIGNTLHFTRGLPLFVLENKTYLHPSELLKQKWVGNLLNSQEFAHASYDRPPNITKPHGDK